MVRKIIIAALLFAVNAVFAEPVVITGAMVPEFIGTKVSGLRVINDRGAVVPFQIDEKTLSGEYVCPQGAEPNGDEANGVLDKQDEIVFLLEDTACTPDAAGEKVCSPAAGSGIVVCRGNERRSFTVVDDSARPLSPVSYITYDQKLELLETPFYYAQFGRDRFHFTRAGVMDFSRNAYCDLTNELRIEISLRALWGLIPIRYTEENLICLVRRYKAGPIRLIRRGNLHLNLGLGLKASRAVVYQICYPQMVKVPVNVHLPVRFGMFFSEAYLEMTPVIRADAGGLRFSVPQLGCTLPLDPGKSTLDTLMYAVPDKEFIVADDFKGFEWLMQLAVMKDFLGGSGYVVRMPSSRAGGGTECGFRLVVRDLPAGRYDIVNWVLFSRNSAPGQEQRAIREPSLVKTSSGIYVNGLVW
ncbi:MAG: hypothetical protein MUF22_03560 [Chitinispirillaceae bacterium]|jgi:hypothetical protein|nr:hypothetical protein [Chitinispirillaceae bacterium]